MDILPTPSESRLSIPAAILIAGVMISGSILYTGSGGTASIFKSAQNPPAGDAPAAVVQNPDSLFGPTDPVLGKADAPVTVVEFSDFQCPFCRQFFIDTFGQLKSQYVDTGKIRIIYRNFPLSFHPAARPAALAALCANDQGKFWEYHDKIFNEQQKKEPDQKAVTATMTFGASDLKTWASQIGLNMTQFNSCLDAEKHGAEIDASIKMGSAAGVSGTPSFFINGKIIIGAQPFSVFQTAIDQALADK